MVVPLMLMFMFAYAYAFALVPALDDYGREFEAGCATETHPLRCMRHSPNLCATPRLQRLSTGAATLNDRPRRAI